MEIILKAYEEGQRHFGENYSQELIAKATDEQVTRPSVVFFTSQTSLICTNFQILERCKDIKWHFVGHLQSNKASKVVSLPNLYIIETIDSQKLASVVNEAAVKNNTAELNVYVQVNTSLEDG